MKAVRLALFLILASMSPGMADAFRAVLIGVSDYHPDLQAVAPPLQGPGHDVALIHDTLRRMGVAKDAISVLSDRPDLVGHDRPAEPTRDNILRALEQEINKAREGQQILIYFAGHGAQIPRVGGADQTELDGLDEVLLPSDFHVSHLDGKRQFVNHITDDEIGSALDRMIAAGAVVWLVADACHSGTLRRSAHAVARYANLGFASAAATQPLAPISRARSGGFVGFYGAQAGELAYEVPIGDKVHGALTWSLAKALRAGEAARFSGLAREISRDLWRHAQGRSRPAFAGNLGARQFFAGAARDDWFALEWSDEKTAFVLKAGQVDGAFQGARVAIYGEDEVRLVSSEIVQADLTASLLGAPDEASGLDGVLLADGLDPARFRDRWLADRAPILRARIISRPIAREMVVALPPPGSVPEALRDALRARIESEPSLRVAQGERAPVRLRLSGERVVFDPSDPGAREALSAPAELGAVPELIGKLRRLAKSRALLGLAETFRVSGPDNGLQTRLRLLRGQRSVAGKCKLASALQDPGVMPDVRDCDQVEVSLMNNGAVALDITPLYLAADHQIYFLSGYEGSAEGGMRLAPGASATLRYTEVTQNEGMPLATGQMHLMFISVGSDGAWPPRDFRHLQDIAPPPLTRGTGSDPLMELLNSAAFAQTLRSSVTPRDIGQAGALVIPLRTVADNRVVRDDEQ